VRLELLERRGDPASPVHQAPALGKLLLTLLFIGVVVSSPSRNPILPAAALLTITLVAAVARISPGHLIRKLVSVEPFVVSVALLSLLQPGGVAIFLSMVIKSSLSVLAMILLVSTTRFGDLLRALRRLRLPGIMVMTLALMHRYIAVLDDETERMRRARASRTLVRGRRRAWSDLAAVAARLFIRSSERAERIYHAMCARGWRT